jgi:hypothetical protein
MKISGPISGPEFNKIVKNMSSKEGGECIKVRRLSFDEVRHTIFMIPPDSNLIYPLIESFRNAKI